MSLQVAEILETSNCDLWRKRVEHGFEYTNSSSIKLNISTIRPQRRVILSHIVLLLFYIEELAVSVIGLNQKRIWLSIQLSHRGIHTVLESADGDASNTVYFNAVNSLYLCFEEDYFEKRNLPRLPFSLPPCMTPLSLTDENRSKGSHKTPLSASHLDRKSVV